MFILNVSIKNTYVCVCKCVREGAKETQFIKNIVLDPADSEADPTGGHVRLKTQKARTYPSFNTSQQLEVQFGQLNRTPKNQITSVS